jgi:predicted ABC-type sugar transport system permease subunit
MSHTYNLFHLFSTTAIPYLIIIRHIFVIIKFFLHRTHTLAPYIFLFVPCVVDAKKHKQQQQKNVKSIQGVKHY